MENSGVLTVYPDRGGEMFWRKKDCFDQEMLKTRLEKLENFLEANYETDDSDSAANISREIENLRKLLPKTDFE